MEKVEKNEVEKTTTKKNEVVKNVQPEKVDRLGKNKIVKIKDANGYEWEYELQFPGMRKALEMEDNCRMENGQLAKSLLFDEYLENVVVNPDKLTIDDFDNRPGMFDLFNEIQTFLTERSL